MGNTALTLTRALCAIPARFLRAPALPVFPWLQATTAAAAGVVFFFFFIWAIGFSSGDRPGCDRSFEMVDRDRSGYIDENELQQVTSSGYQRFSLRTIRLLIFLFKSPTDSLRVGPKEFAALWTCLGQWRSIFERYDKDRSGKNDLMERRDALYGLGLAMPPFVLQILISKYDDGSGRRVELNFDSLVECGMIVRGSQRKIGVYWFSKFWLRRIYVYGHPISCVVELI